MNTPGFSAEAALYKTSGYYQTDRNTINASNQMIGAIYPAFPGQAFPNHTCDCKGCAKGGGDVTGQCASVCKDKTVYAKGSEPNDYCKAEEKKTGWRPPRGVTWYDLGDAVANIR